MTNKMPGGVESPNRTRPGEDWTMNIIGQNAPVSREAKAFARRIRIIRLRRRVQSILLRLLGREALR